jgi:hypothetical protein
MPMTATAHPTEVRAALASGTVKKRMRMCGRPAVPSRKAIPVETVSSGLGKKRPGPRNASPSFVCCVALSMTANGFQLTRLSTSTVRTTTPVMSRTALTICTHVVASMPPKMT